MVIRPYSHLFIETNITTRGAVMEIPGMPAPIGPVSGVLGIVLYWMICADACRILARHGISVKVKGDEPKLAGDKVPWVDLDEPLMDKYFDEVMYQIELIGAELGSIREIARMAADTSLAGGKVYVYSQNDQALACEASYRRGGLCLTHGLYDDNGRIFSSFVKDKVTLTPKDCVIMGVYKPDDVVDLRHLDTFRKNKMRVASLGPMFRDLKIPQGRSVPGETDVHAGRMCDTYGFFAVPGFEQKICPTSGALVNQLFWAVCMEIAEEIIRRTGDVPGVLFSGALKAGPSHNKRVFELYQKRGY